MSKSLFLEGLEVVVDGSKDDHACVGLIDGKQV